MRAYYDLLQHLKATFEDISDVATITTEGYIDMDNWRKSIYPIVDIFVTTSPQLLNTTALARFNVEITCLDIRDINNEEVNDKFWRNDNRHDNWNTTHAILEQAKDRLIKDWNDNNITLNSVTDLERIVLGKENGLDGWRTTWVVDVPKDYNAIC
jgi:energy-converting hydrogenase A subunit M